jgi:hypothetical protein
MLPKTKHLGPENASAFQDDSVVAAYDCCPPYPTDISWLRLGGRQSKPERLT